MRFLTDIKNITNYKHFKFYLHCFIILIGFLFTLKIFWPGEILGDIIDQLEQAKSFVFDSWHPPIPAFIWGCLLRIFPNYTSEPLLILYLTLYWSSFLILGFKFLKNYNFLLFSFMGFFPPLISISGVLWKDVLVCVCVLFYIAICLSARSFYKINNFKFYFLTLISFIILFIAVASRQNSKSIILPTILLYFIVSCNYSYKKSIFLSIIATFLIMLTVSITNNSLIKGRDNYIFQYLIIDDLKTISIAKNKPLFPDYITSKSYFSFDYIKNVGENDMTDLVFRAGKYGPLIYAERHGPIEVNTDKENHNILIKYWLSTIIDNKEIYLKHRFKRFVDFLRIYDDTYQAYPLIPEKNKTSVPYSIFYNLFLKINNSILYRPYFYLLINILLLFTMIYSKFISQNFKNKINIFFEIAFLTNLISLFYILPYTLFAAGPDFRYSYLSIAMTLISSVFLFINFKNK